jgi:hypothetical protein
MGMVIEDKVTFISVAVNLIADIARNQPRFTSKDLWDRLGDVRPAEGRWVGNAFIRAKAAGLIASTGEYAVECVNERGNAKPCLIWRAA